MKSMTGYGKANYFDEKYEIEVEVKSVNSRFLDLKIYLPREMSYVEIKLKELCRQNIKRGKVDVNIHFKDKRPLEIELDENKLQKYWDIFNKAKQILNINTDISLDRILNGKGVIQVKDNESIDLTKIISDTFTNAAIEHQKMALNEGKSMHVFFESSIRQIKSALLKIESEFPEFKKTSHECLKNRIAELIGEKLNSEDCKRILLETALYVEKADINEEIIRLKNHISKFEEKMALESTEIGKSLNFILQEMHREINTVGSKFNSTKIFSEIISIKEEIERCKELVQNVE